MLMNKSRNLQRSEKGCVLHPFSERYKVGSEYSTGVVMSVREFWHKSKYDKKACRDLK